MNPKTGSTSLKYIFYMFEEIQIRDQSHCTLANFIKLYNLTEDFSDYKFYCFYRDPVDRFLSAYSGILEWYSEHTEVACAQEGNMNRFLTLMFSDRSYMDIDFGKAFPIEKTGRPTRGPPLPNEIKNKITSISVLDFIAKMNQFTTEADQYITSKQVLWLDHPNIELLDYARFNEHVHNFLKLYDKDTVPILHKRQRNLEYGKRREDLTSEELLAIQTYYKEDYEFLERHNINKA